MLSDFIAWQQQPPEERQQNPFFLILGMHRSGTSCLAGCFHRCGLYLGKVNRRNKGNPRGTHEQFRVMQANDRILAFNNGSWDVPPVNVRSNRQHATSLAQIVDKLRRCKRPCGVKDPRLLLLLKTWLEAVREPRLIGTFRHPLAVARSLAERDGMTIERGLDLWLIYNRKLVEIHQRQPFPLIKYSLQTIEQYCQSVCDLVAHSGLPLRPSRINRFVLRGLDHSDPDEIVPRRCRDAFEYLVSQQFTAPAQYATQGPQFSPAEGISFLQQSFGKAN